MERHSRRWKPPTRATGKGYFESAILPVPGHLRIGLCVPMSPGYSANSDAESRAARTAVMRHCSPCSAAPALAREHDAAAERIEGETRESRSKGPQ